MTINGMSNILPHIGEVSSSAGGVDRDAQSLAPRCRPCRRPACPATARRARSDCSPRPVAEGIIAKIHTDTGGAGAARREKSPGGAELRDGGAGPTEFENSSPTSTSNGRG